MREIKFRAWDRTLNKWADPSMVYLAGDGTLRGWGDVPLDSQRYILHFVTGQKDKSGVVIYEGDIVEYKISGSRYAAEVYYDTATARYSKRGIDSSYGGVIDKDLVSYASTQQVIGNIYENPELLEAQT